jgi:hypothetical protein
MTRLGAPTTSLHYAVAQKNTWHAACTEEDGHPCICTRRSTLSQRPSLPQACQARSLQQQEEESAQQKDVSGGPCQSHWEQPHSPLLAQLCT